MKRLLLLIISCAFSSFAMAQNTVNDINTPLDRLAPAYKTPYGVPDTTDIRSDLTRILQFLEANTPAEASEDGTLVHGDFRIISYEWGVTYSAMLSAGELLSDQRFTDYTLERHAFLARMSPLWEEQFGRGDKIELQLRKLVAPRVLDDAGAMCVSMIRDELSHPQMRLDPLIKRFADHVLNREYRLGDGTLARNSPRPNTLWLDDMYMGIPTMAWYGKYTGDPKYYDMAVEQIRLFKEKMWVPGKSLFRHGWVEEMTEHPAFCWARANGWAILAITDVLDALPEDHPARTELIDLLRSHAASLSSLQSSEGFWHQLLDRPDSYLETSATAIYAYCLAHGICEGWLDAECYGPAAILAWNALATRIDPQGRVLGTCVGTSMGFDPAFYYYRPTSPYAAHGYGPTLLAGSELIRLIRLFHPIEGGAVHFPD